MTADTPLELFLHTYSKKSSISSVSAKKFKWRIIKYMQQGYRQMVRHSNLSVRFVGSNPAYPISLSIDR